jgi:hypothetical protein
VSASGIGATKERSQPRLQLADVKRLDHVVIRARVQSVDPVGDRIARRQDQDRHAVAEAAQAPADLQAIHARQADVQHHRVRDGVNDRLERLLAVLGHLHLIPAERQRAAHGLAHGPIILDDEDPHELEPRALALALISSAARPRQS